MSLEEGPMCMINSCIVPMTVCVCEKEIFSIFTSIRKKINIVQEVVTKIISKKKKYQEAKWLSEEALQIAEKRRDVKGKGERERYTQLNAEFQRTARREKKAFLSD